MPRFLRLPFLLLVAGYLPLCSGQTAFFNFDTAGQFTSNFNLWNDAGGVNGGNYSFAESAGAGVGGGGGVSVFQSTDTTATYSGGSWGFSTNGAVITVSALIKANALSSGNKVQLGVINVNNNGLNGNTGVAFESFRFIPSGAGIWPLWEQARSAGASANTQIGTVTVAPGRWYKLVVSVTNTAGASGNYTAGCALYDYGTDGLTPGTNAVTFSTVQTHTGQTDVTVPAVWPALRAFQNGGIDAWDDLLVYTPAGPPVITLGLTNTSAISGQTATFAVMADGPGVIGFSWYTNGALVGGASGRTYTTPPLNNTYTNIEVLASNSKGSANSSASISVFVPSAAVITNLPATGVQADSATLKGQVLSTGNDTPTVTLYYGPTDGGPNAAAWEHHVMIGLQSGSFAQAVSGLSSNSTYYYTAEAVNAGGATWAAPSQSFTTLRTNVPAPGAAAVLTHHNDNGRTGRNLNETILNTSNVNTNQFGLLFTRTVDDQIYAQPLIMTNVSIVGKGVQNLVIVVTVNDSVYAFDADDPSGTTPYWTNRFINPPNIVAPANTDMSAIGACGGNYQDFSGNMGIVGTPVIDPAAGTLYLVARTKENGSTFVQRLHALDITTGLDRPNSPVIITATYPGNGAGSSGGIIAFDSQRQNQRPALALVNGVVYIGWSSHCDNGPYHGWVIGYDQSTLQQVAVFNDTPNGSNGGIWMSGQAPAADTSGNLYLSTGNGTVDTSGTVNRGESFLKLTRSGTNLTVTSWFTPYNWQNLENGDVDLGSGGVLLIPGTTLAFSGGKEGVVYLVNRDNMGGLTSSTTTNDNIIQSFSVTTDEVHGGPIWWDGSANSYAYMWPSSVHLQQYVFNPGLGNFSLPAYAQSPTAAPAGQPGGLLALSANGSAAGSGIVWASHQLTGDANQSVRPGILHAYDAENVSRELWNSQQLSARDAVGNFAKFVPPTVANGKVYLATFSGRLDVYGLLSSACTSPKQLSMSGTGSFCTSAGSQVFGVGGTTESDVTYSLKQDGTTVDAKAGTGGAITFAAQSATGAYTVVGTRGSCAMTMNGSATITAAPIAPVPNVSFNVAPRLSLKIKISDLLAAWTGTSLSVQSAGPSSTAGGTVTQDTTYIYYVPPSGSVTSDHIPYTIGSANGCSKATNIDLSIVAAGGVAQTIVVSSSTATIRFYGIPGLQYDVQRATSLGPSPPANWSTITAGNPLTASPNDGSFTYTDGSAPNGTAYYRSLGH